MNAKEVMLRATCLHMDQGLAECACADGTGACSSHNRYVRLIEAQFNALSAAGYEIGPAWQDIDKAPKDGTEVLLQFDGGQVRAGIWDIDFDSAPTWIEPTSFENLPLNYDPPTHFKPITPPESNDVG